MNAKNNFQIWIAVGAFLLMVGFSALSSAQQNRYPASIQRLGSSYLRSPISTRDQWGQLPSPRAVRGPSLISIQEQPFRLFEQKYYPVESHPDRYIRVMGYTVPPFSLE